MKDLNSIWVIDEKHDWHSGYYYYIVDKNGSSVICQEMPKELASHIARLHNRFIRTNK